MTRDELVIKKKEIGKKIADVNTIIQEKKARKEDCSLEIQMKSYYEKELFPVKDALAKEGAQFNEVFLKVVQKALPVDVKQKLEVMTLKCMNENLKMHEISHLDFSLYNESDLEILSSKYPQLMKSISKMIEANNKQKVEARKLMATLNTRLTPDEQHLVKEVKEFLSNIVNK